MSDLQKPYSDTEAIKSMMAGTAIGQTTLRIRSVLQRYTGTSKHGPYSFQKAFGTDKFGEICISFKNIEKDVSALKGKAIRIECGEHQGKPTGLTVIDDKDQNDQPRKTLQVTTSASITITKQEEGPQADGGWIDESEAEGQSEPKQGPPTQGQPQQSQPQSAAAAKESDEKCVSRKLMQTANLMVKCHVAAKNYVAARIEAATGATLSATEVHAMGTSLFIKAERDNLHCKMPAQAIPLEDYTQKS